MAKLQHKEIFRYLAHVRITLLSVVSESAARARHARRFRTPKSRNYDVRKWLATIKSSAYILVVTQKSHRLYRALTAHDARFDGVFFVGVTSTGIYCRPICPAKTPKEAYCRFFDSPQEAEQEGFRPCLRCRPELAPGSAPVDDSQRIAHLIVRRIEEGAMEDSEGLESIADQFELSSRQIRRIIQKELGVSPIQLILTRRLLLAKQLLTETSLPVTEIAFASGFSSLRRFNDAFNCRYGMPPTRLRKKAIEGDSLATNGDTSILQVSYRAPYDWLGMLAFLKARALKGVEWVTDSSYARTVQLGKHKGWIRVTQEKKRNGLMVEFSHTLMAVLPGLLSRVRDLFDLNARPDIINKHLRKDKILRVLIKHNPGTRVPGAFNGFELGLRAILGQQITVKAATTIACRLVEAFSEPIVTSCSELNYLTPSPTKIAKSKVDDLAKYGIVRARSKSIIALAQAHVSGDLSIDSGVHQDPNATIESLTELPGIGPWTAQYIAMRALRWPDAFPKEDIAILNNLGGVTAKRAEEMSQAWRPWRSYAVLHLWRNHTESLYDLKGERK
jgi:AraC family transcriptional regulator, regulatory protein of adaptative response / DNA-3-methyladenine glycosylase II